MYINWDNLIWEWISPLRVDGMDPERSQENCHKSVWYFVYLFTIRYNVQCTYKNMIKEVYNSISQLFKYSYAIRLCIYVVVLFYSNFLNYRMWMCTLTNWNPFVKIKKYMWASHRCEILKPTQPFQRLDKGNALKSVLFSWIHPCKKKITHQGKKTYCK